MGERRQMGNAYQAFLRTAEFLWQEVTRLTPQPGTLLKRLFKMLKVYADFVEGWMALPRNKGIKTESERFAGAVDTYCIEALMQDGKALQAGYIAFPGSEFCKGIRCKVLG